MFSFKDFILSTFSDDKGSISHKRVLATIGAIILFVVYIIGRDSHLADLIFYFVCACMGLATIDKFSK
jgi:hypothetical protein